MAVAAVAGALGLILAIRDTHAVLYDDAAITMRYAYRIAHGDGFTYNPGDRTDGASAPLYTLLLAFINFCGGGLQGAAKVIGLLSYGAVCGLVSYLSGRIAGVAAGVLAPLLLMASTAFRINALSGMESCVVAAIGVAVLVALRERRDTLCGILAGVDLFTRLDAGLLLIAVVAAVMLVRRRIPWRILVWSAAVIAPWLVFAQLYFGSVVPNSARVKATVLAKGVPLDHAWMLRAVQADHGLWTVAFTLVAVPVVISLRNRDLLVPTVALVIWPALLLLAYSYVNLGAGYPWYLVSLFPPFACGAAIAVGGTVGWCVRAARTSVPVMVLAACVALFGCVVLTRSAWSGWTTSVQAVVHGHQVAGYEEFEATRRQTGIYLAGVTRPGQVVETCFGWPAFEDESAVIRETCPLSTRKKVAPPTWGTNASYPATIKPVAPPGAVVVAVFTSPEGGDSWVYEYTHVTSHRGGGPRFR